MNLQLNNLPENLIETQPRLAQGIVTVPPLFDGTVFSQLSAAIAWAKRLREMNDGDPAVFLHVFGKGGDTSDMFACVDLIQAEETSEHPIVGVLYGINYSAHTVLWASCRNRLVMPHGAMAVHSSLAARSSNYGLIESQMSTNTLVKVNKMMAQIYADACANSHYNVHYWEAVLESNQHEPRLYAADEIVNELRMGAFSLSE